MAEIRAELTLIGDDFDLNYVTESLHMKPNYLRRKDEILRNGRFFGHVEWGILTKLYSTSDLSPIIEELLSKVTCPPEALCDIAQQCHAEWHIVILIRAFEDEKFPGCWNFPSIYFPADFIKFCADIKAEMGLDTYII